MTNQRVSCQHYACAVAECGAGENGLKLNLLGETIAEIQRQRDAGQLERPEFYNNDPHIDVSLRNTGERSFRIVHGDKTIGEIGSFHLLREAPRNALYRHNGQAYRVTSIVTGQRIIRVVPEWTRNETTQFVKKDIKQKSVIRQRKYSLLTAAVAKLGVTEYLQAISEKDPSGTTIRSYPVTGMPTHHLPTEGVSLTFSTEFIEELDELLATKTDVVAGSVERLMSALFPTVTGPCDSQDFSSATNRTKAGELAIYLYDNVYDGVNLTERAFDRLGELLDKVVERVETCQCAEDSGCFRCVADPQRDSISSKADTLRLLQRLQQIIVKESPNLIEFEVDAWTDIRDIACSACEAKVPPNSKFCSECGSKIEVNHVGC